MKKRNFEKRNAKEYGIIRKIFYWCTVKFLLIPFAVLFYNIKIEGRENVPKDENFIYTANHVSVIDPPFVSIATGKLIAYMAKKELFEGDGQLAWWVKRLGAFAVNREKPSISTFKTVKEIFKAKSWSLGIFPQGGIREPGKIETLQKGFAFIAQNAKADIIPVAICGFDGYSTKIFSKHITIKIGTPIPYNLPEDELLYKWATQICDMTGFENCLEIPESIKQKESEKV